MTAAVASAVEKLANFLIQQAIYIGGVEGQVERLKDELNRMQSFLKDAAEKEAGDERIRNWITDIQEIAYDTEDVIETYILKAQAPSSRGKLACFPVRAYSFGHKIEAILSRLEDVRRSRDTYGIRNLGGDEASSSSSLSNQDRVVVVEARRRLAPWQEDEHVVGLEQVMEKLIGEAILDGRDRFSVVTIVGMGGIGKSCLARKLYRAVSGEFNCRGWVCVSSQFNPRESIKELMLQLVEPARRREVLDVMEREPLERNIEMLHSHLQGNRYFIVLDDLWENEHLDVLAKAFPREDKESRLLITSRNNRIATTHAPYVHEMRVLEPEKSWELLLKRAFIDNVNGVCPQDLEGVGKEILNKCDGLPLAITVVGGLLVDKNPSKRKWENVLKEINFHLGPKCEGGGSVFTILELSFRNLPPHLKPCFMCLSFFMEDSTIRLKTLVHVWDAIGLLPQESGRGQTVEDIGASYFEELVNRHLVQVQTWTKDGFVKEFKLHDLIHELSIAKAKKEMRLEICRLDGKSEFVDRPRHRVEYARRGCTEKFNRPKNQNKHIRSLFLQGSKNRVLDSSPSYWKSFRLLKAVDFGDFSWGYFPEVIGHHVTGLKYLGLRGTFMQRCPRSLACFKSLEVLDISHTWEMALPDSVCEMDNLRHLYVDLGTEVPLKIGCLKKLETLESVVLEDQGTLEKLAHMTKLRKLGMVINIDLADSSEFWTSVARLENLERLNLKVNGFLSFDGLGMLRSLTNLKLQRKVSNLPSAVDFPPKLSCLTLLSTWIEPDTTSELSKLPELEYLKLIEAYKREELVISADGFPKLKVLSLQWMPNLKTLQVEHGGIPQLERLEIGGCPNLKGSGLPQQVRSITNVQDDKYFCVASDFGLGSDHYSSDELESV